MSTQSGIARRVRATWRITNHAIERLGDRGVAATELLDLLLAPGDERQFDTDEDGRPLYCAWNSHIGVVYVHAPDWETGDSVKLILSVYLNDAGKDNWEKDAVALAGKRRSMRVIQLDKMHEWAEEMAPAPLTKYKPKKKPAAAPVVTRNVYDEVPGNMMATARRMLRQMGLDPKDMRPVVVLGPNRIEIDPTRLKRAG